MFQFFPLMVLYFGLFLVISSEKSKQELSKHTVFMEYLKEEEEQEQENLQSELYFDLSYFKANRKV